MIVREFLNQQLCRHHYIKVAVHKSDNANLWECKKCEQLYIQPRFGRGGKVTYRTLKFNDWDDAE